MNYYLIMASSLYFTTPFTIFVWFFFFASSCHAAQSDIDCLRAIKASFDAFEDPLNSLSSSWNFDLNNNISGFICKFTGVECWHDDENKVLNLGLSDMGLKGEFPLGIVGCSSMTGLDLSSNEIFGKIPMNISKLIPSVTTLDLSSNQLSGEIPTSLSKCRYLNVLKLDNNQLSGQIPRDIGLLDRIQTFSVANNRLTGQVPIFVNEFFSEENYANNSGLCGGPLRRCVKKKNHNWRKNHTWMIVGAAVGWVTFTPIGFAIGIIFFRKFLEKKKRNKKEGDPLGNKWAKSIEGTKQMKVIMFEKSVISTMNLSDLMKATDDFSKENIIECGSRNGTMYEAVLEDGTSLMVKRSNNTQKSQKEFISDMKTLGNLKHRNLVPFLGFCTTKKERFLVYKNMPNSTLHDKLHAVNDNFTNWPLRLRVGIRAAKGFAWLHHSCNPRIIHGHISSKCILLDVNYEPRILYSGVSKINPIHSHFNSFVEFGYVAPEYAQTLRPSLKGDVYSFGVVLLELVTGERATYVAQDPYRFKGNLVEWISQLSSASKLQDAIDESFSGKGYDSELLQFLKAARSCVLTDPKERPTMLELYRLLRAIGHRYEVTTEEDILVLSDVGNEEDIVELMDARDEQEIKLLPY